MTCRRFLASNWPVFSTIFAPDGASGSFLFAVGVDTIALLPLELSAHSEAAGALILRLEPFAMPAVNDSMRPAAATLRPGERLRICLRRGSLPVALVNLSASGSSLTNMSGSMSNSTRYRLDCSRASDLLVDFSTSQVVTRFLPYPQAGTWFLALELHSPLAHHSLPNVFDLLPAERFVQLWLTLSTSGCVEGGCGDKGHCEWRHERLFLYSTCECQYA